MSSSAVRLITNSSPSRASSRPATQPSRVDLVIRRAIRAVIKIDNEPTSATANRQPNGVSPNSHSPPAITTLPSGGWTTNSAPRPRMLVLPRASSASALLTWLISAPCLRMP